MSNTQNPNQQGAQNREPRATETREALARPQSWAPPDLLPEPDLDPDYVFRWCRTAINGEEDPMNMSRSMREGFAIVKPEEQPRLSTYADPRAIKQRGTIEYGGLILMKAPKEFMEQRAKYYANKTRQEQIAVDNDLMKEQDRRMPIIVQRDTKVSFGTGGR